MEMTSEIVGVDNLDLSAYEKTPAPARLFSLHDRCDRCDFQAYYVAQKDTSELCFCAHHGNQHMVILMAKGWIVLDFTSELDAKNEAEVRPKVEIKE